MELVGETSYIMKYYPVNLDLNKSHCLVVGGGSIACRKIVKLVKSCAKVTVVSPEAIKDISKMYEQGYILLKTRKYKSSDILNKFLVIGATNNELVNIKISEDAKKHSVLYNIVDKPEICNFILPAIVERGDFVLTISTSGNSPAFAKKLRKEFEMIFGVEYGQLLELMGAIRKKLLGTSSKNSEEHKFLFEKLLDNNLLHLVKNRDVVAIDEILNSVLGADYRYKKLIS